MKRAHVRQVVRDYIHRLLERNQPFDDQLDLQTLGLDKQDLEELIFHLEDEFGLTAFTHEEDQLLKAASTANDLSQFLLKISRH
ncbi:phosphopantetheine-containing protein [Pseudomonas sp. MF4836]|uniref:phosphopantetheine-containing protein n=1 Tax=Pseudomonas sp. MF4836 TaxID=1960827 RepID=UPI0009981370|nr:phosphopantetheine-containing protein [Pseudomonas sp. MF4836]OOV89543.1 phosphopantetheine-containing protein [Pseudomonas sp. MF4836]